MKKSHPSNLTKQRAIRDATLEKYISVTTAAIKKVKLQKSATINVESSANDFFDMAQRYLADAHYFAKQGDIVRAFAAVNYAHGWLDAGARIGLFDVDGDDVLFTVDGKK